MSTLSYVVLCKIFRQMHGALFFPPRWLAFASTGLCTYIIEKEPAINGQIERTSE